MKILLVSDYGNLAGGAELQLEMLRQGLRARGHDARLFASTARPDGSASLADDECVGTTSRWRTLLQSFNPWAYLALRRVLADFRPDVVHVFMFLTQLSPAILPLLRTVPSVYYVVWYRPICPLGTKMWPDGSECHVAWGRSCLQKGCLPWRDWLPLMLQMRLWQRWRNAFDVIGANSAATKQRLQESCIDATKVLWPGVPVEPLSRPLSPEPTAVFAGRLVREKGVDVLARAFSDVARQVPAARLVLAGDGPERSAIQEQIRRLGLTEQVTMPGQLAREPLQRAFAGAWVQAVPSRWAEPFGMVAAEAMMRGTPVVASDAGGLREIVWEGRTGFLVPPGDAPGLAEA
ncbi:MAG: glycosyltransferase, partial [Acidobacteriota bacterium]